MRDVMVVRIGAIGTFLGKGYVNPSLELASILYIR